MVVNIKIFCVDKVKIGKKVTIKSSLKFRACLAVEGAQASDTTKVQYIYYSLSTKNFLIKIPNSLSPLS
jgi:hypothetical protein